MAGDSKAQAAYFGRALGGPGAQGWMMVNEVRRLKNLPPIPDGDTLYRPDMAAAPGLDDQDDDDEPKKDDDETA